MAIFRIVGGNNSSNNGGNNRSNLVPDQQSTGASAPIPSRTNANAGRHMYPGQRVPPNRGQPSFPSAPGRVGGNVNPMASMSTMSNALRSAPPNPACAPPPSATANNNNNPTNVLVRGSNVEVNRPGAYAVTRVTTGPAQVYRVTVPPGVRPGSEFNVHAGPRRVRVRCPASSGPGSSLQITLPPEPVPHHVALKMAPLTAPTEAAAGGGAVVMTKEVQRVNQQASDSGGTAQTFLVTIPDNIYPGMQFTVNINKQRFMVTCPENAGPNKKVRIVPPTQPEEPTAAPKTQVFEVTVPAGVLPNQPFTLMANGQRVLVTCPPNVVPGQRIRFELPVQQAIGNIQLSYEAESSGWCRTIRVTDLKFQWIRVAAKEEHGAAAALDAMDTFDFSKAAYVRKIHYMEGNDARMRTGTVELVPANEAVVDSKLVYQNETLLSYADITNIQRKSLDEKTTWFQGICSQLTSPWDDGHVKVVVRRHNLLSDSVDSVMSLGREDMRKRWRIEFLGEPGIDAGGVTREWFQLVTEQLFDPDFGLWLSSVNNQMCMTINPASNISCPDDHLIYFRFLGRVMGRALFDRQLIKGHMVRHLYKHLLGWPITFEDLEAQDEGYYQSLKKFTTMQDLSVMCLDFTITEETMGVRRDVELIPGGNMKEVTAENLPQYLEANLRYRMLDRTSPQITEILLGFFDVIPEPALTVFDPNELELILCGLPEIDMYDWECNTIYSGLFESKGKRNKVVEWFWEVVRNDFDQEMKARLLQFVTGTSGVPAKGFSVLQGNDGNIKRFAIHGVDRNSYVYPRAHTCFNRIDLPTYASKKELYEKLKAAITLSAVGFDME
eukprot:Nitzschia sp. Nitz4//scaffold265_size26576//3226//5822//NITZ4_008244-RA/size26576-augustus-gene-0.20-mRNA-1//1//CDS//3329544828//3611//frame0